MHPDTCRFGALWSPRARPDLSYGAGGVGAGVLVEGPPLGRLRLGAGERFAFSVVLLGRACREEAAVVAAMGRAGARGLGNRRVPFRVVDVGLEGPGGTPAGRSDALPEVKGRDVSIRVETPLWLRSRGREIRRAPVPAELLVRALCRRAGMMADYHAPDLHQPDWSAVVACSRDLPPLDGDLSWVSWRRRSHIQGREMKLPGLVGHLRWTGVPAELTPLLSLGTILHLGKSASLGLGRYRLEMPEEADDGGPATPFAGP